MEFEGFTFIHPYENEEIYQQTKQMNLNTNESKFFQNINQNNGEINMSKQQMINQQYEPNYNQFCYQKNDRYYNFQNDSQTNHPVLLNQQQNQYEYSSNHIPYEHFESQTYIQSSQQLIPLIQSNFQDGSSNTLSQEYQVKKQTKDKISLNTPSIQNDDNQKIYMQSQSIKNGNHNEYFINDSTSTEEYQQQHQLAIQRINKFKYPDMKYETSQLNYRENYYVIGDLFININMYLDGAKKDRRDKSSIWNQIRPVNHIQINANGYTSIAVDDTQSALEDFDRIIALLNKQFCSHAKQQAEWLVQYKQYICNLENTRKKIFDEYSHNTQLIKQKLAQNTLKSIQMAEEILSKYYGGKNDYIIYTYRRTNSNNLSQTLYKGGMSNAMLKLIYITEENFRVDTLRHGMLELFSYEGYESVNYSYIFGDSQVKQDYRKFSIFTVDDLEIELEMQEIPYQLSKVSLSGGTWCSDQMRVYKFRVSPQQIFQLSIMRKELSYLNNDDLYKNTEYYAKSEDFVNKFYKQSKSFQKQ